MILNRIEGYRMFGKILEVHEYNIRVENATHKVETGLIGVHIVFESQ